MRGVAASTLFRDVVEVGVLARFEPAPFGPRFLLSVLHEVGIEQFDDARLAVPRVAPLPRRTALANSVACEIRPVDDLTFRRRGRAESCPAASVSGALFPPWQLTTASRSGPVFRDGFA